MLYPSYQKSDPILGIFSNLKREYTNSCGDVRVSKQKQQYDIVLTMALEKSRVSIASNQDMMGENKFLIG